MKYFWYCLSRIVIAALYVGRFFVNVRLFAYNLFHTDKKPISWNVIREMTDPTEDFYHH